MPLIKYRLHGHRPPPRPIQLPIPGWGGDPLIVSAAATVSAFTWPDPASADAALLLTLAPGAYTAVVSGVAGDTGVSLLEVYDVP